MMSVKLILNGMDFLAFLASSPINGQFYWSENYALSLHVQRVFTCGGDRIETDKGEKAFCRSGHDTCETIREESSRPVAFRHLISRNFPIVNVSCEEELTG